MALKQVRVLVLMGWFFFFTLCSFKVQIHPGLYIRLLTTNLMCSGCYALKLISSFFLQDSSQTGLRVCAYRSQGMIYTQSSAELLGCKAKMLWKPFKMGRSMNFRAFLKTVVNFTKLQIFFWLRSKYKRIPGFSIILFIFQSYSPLPDPTCSISPFFPLAAM